MLVLTSVGLEVLLQGNLEYLVRGVFDVDGLVHLTSAGPNQCWPEPVLALISAGPDQCWSYPTVAGQSRVPGARSLWLWHISYGILVMAY